MEFSSPWVPTPPVVLKGSESENWSPFEKSWDNGMGCHPSGFNCRPLDHHFMGKMLGDNPSSYRYSVLDLLEFAIDEINAETGSNYKLVDIVKVVNWSIFDHYFTFTVVDNRDDVGSYADLETLVAVVHAPIRRVDAKPRLVDWRFKGDKASRGPKPKPV